MLKKASIYSLIFYVYASNALAQEHHTTETTGSADMHTAAASAEMHEASGAAAHHASAGLPQLDPSSYASQVFWLFLVFAFLYFFFSKKSLPEIAQVIENRHDRVRNDLDTAQNIKNEVASVQKSYEENLAKSHAQAASLLKSTELEMKEKAEHHLKRIQENAVSQTIELEKSIVRARNIAMEDMTKIASEIAIEASVKIIGVRPDANEASEAVKSLYKNNKSAKAA